MIQKLIKNGFVQEAYEQVQPMVKRVKDNNGFYERYSADVLYQAISMFESWSKSN